MKNKTMLPFFLTLCAVIFWGANFNVGKILVEHFSSLDLAAFRFLCSFLLLIPLVLFIENTRDLMVKIKKNFWIYILLSLVGIVGYTCFFFEGLKNTTAINAALIMATNPMLTMLLSTFFLKEKMNLSQQFGMLISLVSVMIVITQGSLTELLHLKVSMGDLIIFLANVCWSLYNVLAKRYLKNSTPLITTTVTMLIGAVVLIIFNANVVIMYQTFLYQSFDVYCALIYMVALGTVLAYLFWNYGVSKLGASKTAIFFNAIPVVTTVIAIFLGQSVSVTQLVGGLGVIFGVLLSISVIRLPRRSSITQPV